MTGEGTAHVDSEIRQKILAYLALLVYVDINGCAELNTPDFEGQDIVKEILGLNFHNFFYVVLFQKKEPG